VSSRSPTYRAGLSAVALYAVAMAYVEAAVVVYLRAVYGIEDLVADLPLLPDAFTVMEVGREAATLLMLGVVGWFAGRGRQDRLGYAVFAFGLWDIFYYIWLRAFIGWPASLTDWDILFLIPLPWWGPVLAPVLIALLLAVGGGVAVIEAARGKPFRARPLDWWLFGAGTLLALYLFMADAVGALPDGIAAIGQVRPTRFQWPLFFVALVAMSLPLARVIRASRLGGEAPAPPGESQSEPGGPTPTER